MKKTFLSIALAVISPALSFSQDVTLSSDMDAFLTTANDAAALTELGAAPIASPALTGDPTAPTATTGDNDTSISTTAFVQQELRSAEDTITATGADLAGAYQLSASYNTITAGAADTGVKLPASVGGKRHIVVNSSGSAKRVYPASGEQIAAGGAGTHVTMLDGEVFAFIGTGDTGASGGDWHLQESGLADDSVGTAALNDASDTPVEGELVTVGASSDFEYVAFPVAIGVAASDETTDLTTGTAKITFRAPYAFTLTAVRANVNTAPVGSTLNVDINEAGVSVLSTVVTIDASEETSTTAATAAVISDSAIADDAEITIDIDQVGSTTAGKGLKVWLIGTRTL